MGRVLIPLRHRHTQGSVPSTVTPAARIIERFNPRCMRIVRALAGGGFSLPVQSSNPKARSEMQVAGGEWDDDDN